VRLTPRTCAVGPAFLRIIGRSALGLEIWRCGRAALRNTHTLRYDRSEVVGAGRYSDEDLSEAVRGSRSYREAIMRLGPASAGGNRTDNRIENLRLICPNCHALTGTYRGHTIGRRAEVVERHTRSS
jgi:hypothetical protein